MTDRWQSAPHVPTLGVDDLHVWRASLTVAPDVFVRLARTLSEDERRRADRYRLPRDRDRFVAARGMLRSLIARYLGSAACAVQLAYTPHGKPLLADRESGGDLSFNLAHAGDIALFVFGRGVDIGVDVERLRRDPLDDGVAKLVCSARERAVLRALPEPEQLAAFFACWTRKEAYVKARGQGLSIPLDALDVSLEPGEPAALLASREDTSAPSRWTIRELPVGSEYAAALAVEGDSWRLTCWDW